MNFNVDDDIVQASKSVWHETETHLAHELKNESSLLSKPLSTNSAVPGNIHQPQYLDFWTKVLNVDDNFKSFLIYKFAFPKNNFNTQTSKSFW